jgi:hypothetical protein
MAAHQPSAGLPPRVAVKALLEVARSKRVLLRWEAPARVVVSLGQVVFRRAAVRRQTERLAAFQSLVAPPARSRGERRERRELEWPARAGTAIS